MGGFFGGGGGGGSVDLASPSAIGSTTPNTGAFTTLSANNGTITTSSPAFTLAQTWNAGAVAFTAIQTNITSTAAASGSLFADFRAGGTSQCSIGYNGTNPVFNIKSTTSTVYSIAGNGSSLLFYYASDRTLSICFTFGVPGIVMPSNGTYGFGSGTDVSSGAGDVYLARDSANTLAQRNSTNAQAFKLYRTFTNSSNYERLGILATRTTRYTITSENAGTGSARSLEVSFYTAASDPTSTDITSGCFSVWKNSGTGIVKLWANDGGTMKSVALA